MFNQKDQPMQTINLTFRIFKSSEIGIGDTKWCVVCKETSMLIGCYTRQEAMELKRNWSSWEFFDNTKFKNGERLKFNHKPHGKNYIETVELINQNKQQNV
jgi:hypothetical protein